jgi:ATP-binding cassette subfamily F protein uup
MQEAPRRQAKGQIEPGQQPAAPGQRAIEAEDLAVRATDAAHAAGGQPLLRNFSYDFSPEDRHWHHWPQWLGQIHPAGA